MLCRNDAATRLRMNFRSAATRSCCRSRSSWWSHRIGSSAPARDHGAHLGTHRRADRRCPRSEGGGGLLRRRAPLPFLPREKGVAGIFHVWCDHRLRGRREPAGLHRLQLPVSSVQSIAVTKDDKAKALIENPDVLQLPQAMCCERAREQFQGCNHLQGCAGSSQFSAFVAVSVKWSSVNRERHRPRLRGGLMCASISHVFDWRGEVRHHNIRACSGISAMQNAICLWHRCTAFAELSITAGSGAVRVSRCLVGSDASQEPIWSVRISCGIQSLDGMRARGVRRSGR